MELYTYVNDWWAQLGNTKVPLNSLLLWFVVGVCVLNLLDLIRRRGKMTDPHARRTHVNKLLAEEYSTALMKLNFKGQLTSKEWAYRLRQLQTELHLPVVTNIRWVLEMHPEHLKQKLKVLKYDLLAARLIRMSRRANGHYVERPLETIAKIEAETKSKANGSAKLQRVPM